MYYLDCKTSFYKHCNCSNVYTCVLEYCRSINLHDDNISLFCYPNWFCGDNLGSMYGIMQKSFDEDFNKIWSPAEFSAFIELFLKIMFMLGCTPSCFNIFFTGFLMLDGRVPMPWTCYRFINVCHKLMSTGEC